MVGWVFVEAGNGGAGGIRGGCNEDEQMGVRVVVSPDGWCSRDRERHEFS